MRRNALKLNASMAAIIMAGGLALILPTAANASEEVQTYSAGSDSYSVPVYSRVETKVRMTPPTDVSAFAVCNQPGVTCSNLVVGQPFDVKCTGGGSKLQNDQSEHRDGGWSVQEGGTCWESITVCTGGECTDYGSSSPAAILNASSTCTPGEDDKGACSHNYGGKEVTISTGDDMYAIADGAASYLEIQDLDLGSAHRLKFISRNGGENYDLMIPSGPDRNSRSDYIQFLNATPDFDFVTVEDGCYPVDITACQNAILPPPPPTPPENGDCGPADGQTDGNYRVPGDINAADMCNVGTAVNIVDTGNSITWQCDGLNGGAASPVCSVYKGEDGQCGPANGGTYGSEADARAAGLCATGSDISFAQSGANWNWTCTGNYGGSDASCSATVLAACSPGPSVSLNPSRAVVGKDVQPAISHNGFTVASWNGANLYWRDDLIGTDGIGIKGGACNASKLVHETVLVNLPYNVGQVDVLISDVNSEELGNQSSVKVYFTDGTSGTKVYDLLTIGDILLTFTAEEFGKTGNVISHFEFNSSLTPGSLACDREDRDSVSTAIANITATQMNCGP